MSNSPVFSAGRVAGSGKNLLMNGDMTIWQRGLSALPAGSYTADRWYKSGGTSTGSRSSSSPTSAFNGSLRLGAACNVRQTIELPLPTESSTTGYGDIPPGTVVTASFWFQSDVVGTNVYLATYWRELMASGTATNDLPATLVLTTVDIEWSFVEFTYTITTEKLAKDNYLFSVEVDNGPFRIQGVQFEVGSTATEFEHITPADQLARCQRYYYEVNPTSIICAPGYVQINGGVWDVCWLPVQMRTAPTAEITLDQGGPGFAGSVSVNAATPQFVRMVNTCTVTTNGAYYQYKLSADAEF